MPRGAELNTFSASPGRPATEESPRRAQVKAESGRRRITALITLAIQNHPRVQAICRTAASLETVLHVAETMILMSDIVTAIENSPQTIRVGKQFFY
jgi:hypothetical protein